MVVPLSKKAGASSPDKAQCLLGDSRLGPAMEHAPIGEGGVRCVEGTERATVRAGDAPLLLQHAQITPGRCLRNFQPGTHLRQGKVTVVFEQRSQRLAPGGNDRGRDFHPSSLGYYMIDVTHIIAGSIRRPKHSSRIEKKINRHSLLFPSTFDRPSVTLPSVSVSSGDTLFHTRLLQEDLLARLEARLAVAPGAVELQIERAHLLAELTRTKEAAQVYASAIKSRPPKYPLTTRAYSVLPFHGKTLPITVLLLVAPGMGQCAVSKVPGRPNLFDAPGHPRLSRTRAGAPTPSPRH